MVFLVFVVVVLLSEFKNRMFKYIDMFLGLWR